MGQLFVGIPLSWKKSREFLALAKERGVCEFIDCWYLNIGKECDALLWGDEIEYFLIHFDDDKEKVTISLNQAQVLGALNEIVPVENLLTSDSDVFEKTSTDPGPIPSWHPEYGSFMIESSPGKPFGSSLSNLLNVEKDMRERRNIIARYLETNEKVMSMTVFPSLGVGEFSTPFCPVTGPISESSFLPDTVINEHIRFPMLTINIRERKGSKVVINTPVFRDIETPWPWKDLEENKSFLKNSSFNKLHDLASAVDNHIYMDAMGFGMGNCCLQVTFQASNVNEARLLYDLLTPITPILMALTAASPIFKGTLADTDCRWNTLSQSVDDRTPQEVQEICKSRYDSVSCYISDDPRSFESYNDINLKLDKKTYETLIQNGIDHKMAQHISWLFIRDPLVLFKESIENYNPEAMIFFEAINTSNWLSMRFKPPPINTDIGWRVEFRTMEVQPTDFENAAFCIFLVLLTRTIISYNLNFYMPISLVDENMKRADARNSCQSQKFWFRKNIFPKEKTSSSCDSEATEIIELSCNELINGTSDKQSFPGLAPLIVNYLNSIGPDVETLCSLKRYIDHIRKIAQGKIPTMASRIRNFVQSHMDYKKNSHVPEKVIYDLFKKLGRKCPTSAMFVDLLS